MFSGSRVFRNSKFLSIGNVDLLRNLQRDSMLLSIFLLSKLLRSMSGKRIFCSLKENVDFHLMIGNEMQRFCSFPFIKATQNEIVNIIALFYCNSGYESAKYQVANQCS